MKDKEFEELKKKVEKETQRRFKIEELRRQIIYLRNGLNFVVPNGWTSNEKVVITETFDEAQGADGNGGTRQRTITAEFRGNDIKLLIEALEDMASKKEEEYKKLMEDNSE